MIQETFTVSYDPAELARDAAAVRLMRATGHRRAMADYFWFVVAMCVLALGMATSVAGDPGPVAATLTLAVGAAAFAVLLFPSYRRAVLAHRAARQAFVAAGGAA